MSLIKTLGVLLVTVGASNPVWAHYPSHHFRTKASVTVVMPPYQAHYHHHHYRAAYYPYGYYTWPYYAPVVIAPAVTYTVPAASSTIYPVTEVQQVYIGNDNVNTYPPPRVVAPNPGKDWLYCHQPDGFYPAIRTCPGGWQRVPAQTPR